MISIIIPTLNEALNIKKLIPEISKNLKKYKYEIIVVDDSSPDGTYEVAKKLEKKYRVRAVKRKGKKDLSLSVIEGFNRSKGNILVVMDADWSHPPELLPELIKELDKNDIVIASRYIKEGHIEDWPFYRYIISDIGRLLAKPLTSVKDSPSGFFAFKKNVIKSAKLKPCGFKILLEILVKGKYNHLKEIPYSFRNRNIGRSKISVKTYSRYLRHLSLLYKYKFYRNI